MVMVKHFFFLFWCLLLGFQVQSQEKSVGSVHDIFSDSIELTLFTQYQDKPFFLLQSVHPAADPDLKKWERLISKLDRKSRKKISDERFLRNVFYLTQRILFREYEIHSNFTGMLQEGVFDCVSGSAAYALLLDRYGYDYELIETDYHVFLMTKLEDQQIIFESTERLKGFKSEPTEVSHFIQQFLPSMENMADLDLNRRLGKLEPQIESRKLFERISLQNLAGIQYYNDAIDAFNQGNYLTAHHQLIKAAHLYPSERIIRLKNLMGQLNP